jgi:hypothetical protein
VAHCESEETGVGVNELRPKEIVSVFPPAVDHAQTRRAHFPCLPDEADHERFDSVGVIAMQIDLARRPGFSGLVCS